MLTETIQRHVWLSVALSVASMVIGVAAWVLKWLIAQISSLCMSGLKAVGYDWMIIVLPVVGIMLTGLIVRRVVRWPLEHATERIKARVVKGDGNMPLRLTVASIVTNAITLGSGGSAGAEGPIADTGAAIGSNIARVFKLDRRGMLVLMACGAGAGIAAIFKSPVGGIFFTLEVLRMQLGIVPVLMLAAMCLISSQTASALSDFGPDLVLGAVPASFSWHMMLPMIGLGIFCGVYSCYYKASGDAVARRLHGIKAPVVRNIASGLFLGIILYLFPALYGEGYEVLVGVADGHMQHLWLGSVLSDMSGPWLPLCALGGILLLKGVAASDTNSGGGVAGEFAPTLFAGGMAGACFSMLVGPELLPMETAVICGMAGGMSGVIQAPIMAVFLTVEMSRTPDLILPVCLVAVVSVAVVKGLSLAFQGFGLSRVK
ncbi:MAG: chloride channel protein [Muribaculaceae bacterium]|nr:chloride channel protein [Muribaculaceae bacterium]